MIQLFIVVAEEILQPEDVRKPESFDHVCHAMRPSSQDTQQN